jgi:hypothetical protein
LGEKMEIEAAVGLLIMCFVIGVMVGEIVLWHKITYSLSDFINKETKYYAQKAIDEILNKKH